MEKPILDPPIPYIGPIYGGRFAPGKMVRIQGTVPSVAYRFEINLQCGPESIPPDDIALQVSVWILDGMVTLNSLHNEIWGEEERRRALPIKRAERFEIVIQCDFSQYKIAINGQHYCEFPQRIRYDRINHMSIYGDVSIIQISYETHSELTPSESASSSSSLASITVPFLTDEDFEPIDSSKIGRSGLHAAAPAVGFAQPPPYENIVPDHQRAPSPYKAPSAGNADSVVPPFHSSGVPGASNMAPDPTGVPGTVGMSPYPPPGALGIPPPQPVAPTSLNAASSNFRPVKTSRRKKRLISCIRGIFTFIIVCLVLILAAAAKDNKKRNKSSTYHEEDNNNDYNSYDDSTNHGGYNRVSSGIKG